MSIATPREVLNFWFEETPPERHFTVDSTLDATVRARFEATWRAARDGALDLWRQTPEGSLALVIVLDQFPRNMFRDTPEAYSTDDLAREVARGAVSQGFDLQVPAALRMFFYLAFQHSERLEDQENALRLTRERLGESDASFPYALRHRDVIAHFGRFPARNAALGRESTAEEIVFLKTNPNGF